MSVSPDIVEMAWEGVMAGLWTLPEAVDALAKALDADDAARGDQ